MIIPNLSKIQTKYHFVSWLVLGLALLFLGGFVAYYIYSEYNLRIDREQDRLSHQVNVVSDNMERQLKSVNLALEDILAEISDLKGGANDKGSTNRLLALTNAMPGVRYIGILDEQGRLVAANLPGFIGADFSQRDYFKTAKQRPNAATLYVSPPFESLHGPYVINLTRVILGTDGKFDGVVTASLEPDFFRTLMASVIYRPDMWDSIAHGDGQLFLIEPTREGVQGMNLAQPGSLFNQHKASGKIITVLTGKAYATNQVRMMAQRTIQPVTLKMDKPLVVAVSRDLDMILRPWRQNSLALVIFFVLIAVTLILGLYVYLKGQKKLMLINAETTAALMQSEELFRLTFNVAATGMALLNLDGYFLRVNDAMCSITGYTRMEMLRKSFQNITHPNDLDADLDLKRELLDGTRDKYNKEKRYLHKDGHIVWVMVDYSAIHDSAGMATYFVAQVQDITKRRELQEQLELKAHQDYLTGLSNRRYFIEQGEAELARAQRYNKVLSLFMIDIDHFKNINDTHGHKAGDFVLQKLSNILQETLRTVDIIGRVGGEEFAILLPETELQKAVEVAERLREIVARTDVVLEGGLPLNITISIGVAKLKGKDGNLDILLHLADKALYEAKAAGRNKVCVAD